MRTVLETRGTQLAALYEAIIGRPVALQGSFLSGSAHRKRLESMIPGVDTIP